MTWINIALGERGKLFEPNRTNSPNLFFQDCRPTPMWKGKHFTQFAPQYHCNYCIYQQLVLYNEVLIKIASKSQCIFNKYCLKAAHKICICDTIKGNESHVGNIQFWFFNINHLPIYNATFWSKPHLNWTPGCRDIDNSLKFKNNVKHKNL